MNKSERRQWLGGVGALLVALLGQNLARSGVSLAWLLLPAGAFAFVFVFRRRQDDPVLHEAGAPIDRPWAAAKGDTRRACIGGALVGAAALMAFAAGFQFHRFEPNACSAWLWLGAAVVAALGGAALLDHGLQPPSAPVGHASAPGGEWDRVWLAAIVALAAALRLWRLGELPFGLWFDEGEHGMQALRILGTPRFCPIFEGAITGPAHHLYLVAVAFKFFGASVSSIRLVSALFGVLTSLAGYLLGVELFGRRRIGLLLAAFLAVSSWAVTLSRFGLYATMSTPLFTVLTAALLLRALRTGRLLAYAAGGLTLGLGLCFYTSFRLFVPAVALFLAAVAVHARLTRRTWPSPAFWAGTALFAVVAAIVASPLAIYALNHPEVFWARVQATFIFHNTPEAGRWPALAESLRRHLLMFNVLGDDNGRHNLPGNPMLDPVAGPLFVAGTAYALRFALAPRYLLLLSWLCFGLMGGVLSLPFEAPQALRANGALPAAYVLAVIPLAVLVRVWPRSAASGRPHGLAWLTGALVGIVAILNIHTYFVQQARHPDVWVAHSTPETLAAKTMADLDATADAYVSAYFCDHPAIRFLLPPTRDYHCLDSVPRFPLDLSPERSAVLILGEHDGAIYEEARRLYPEARVTATSPPDGSPPVFFVVRLSPREVASIRGVTARYYPDTSGSGEPAITRTESELAADWRQEAPLPFPFAARWDGVLHVPACGVYEFYLAAPAAARLRLGKHTVLTGAGEISTAVSLAEGPHELQLEAVGAPGRLTLLWRPPSRPVERIPPTRLYNVPALAHGLLGRYFANDSWHPPEALCRIDRHFTRYFHVTPLDRPYTVEWTGTLAAQVDGLYRFGLEAIDEAALWLDDTPVVATDAPNTLCHGKIVLAAGRHDLRIRFADRTAHTYINVYWEPPGGGREPLPTEILSPP